MVLVWSLAGLWGMMSRSLLFCPTRIIGKSSFESKRRPRLRLFSTGVAGISGILQALMQRAEKGGSWTVDVSIPYLSHCLLYLLTFRLH